MKLLVFQLILLQGMGHLVFGQRIHNDVKGQDTNTTRCSKKYLFKVKLCRMIRNIRNVINSLISNFSSQI